MRLVSCHECSDGAGLPFGGRASDHRRVRCCRKIHKATQADLCRLDRQQSGYQSDVRKRSHSELPERGRSGGSLHASCTLPRGSGPTSCHAAEPAGRIRAGPERRLQHSWKSCCPRTPISRSTQVSSLLTAYQIPAIAVQFARDPDDAVTAARSILRHSPAVVLKIRSPDITHKSDVRGVALNLNSEEAVRRAAETILATARAMRPQARIDGLTVHPMISRLHARELVAGIGNDPTYGPVVMFGSGGTAVEVVNDKALALPPVDLHLARDLIGRTRTARLLKAYRDVPAADEEALALLLVKVAELAADLPEITELDLNPILANDEGVIVLDARIATSNAPVRSRLAIRPYPKEWERTWPSPQG